MLPGNRLRAGLRKWSHPPHWAEKGGQIRGAERGWGAALYLGFQGTCSPCKKFRKGLKLQRELS